MKRIIISEEKFNKVLRTIKEQEESEFFEISAEDFLRMLKYTSGDVKALGRIKKTQGKPIKVIGDLNLSNTNVTSLGDVVEVTGSLNLSGLNIENLGNLKRVYGVLDIGNSKVKSVEGVSYKSIRKWGSTLEKLEIARQEREKRLEADQRRKENIWDLNDADIDDEGTKANALFENLVGRGLLEEIDYESQLMLNSLNNELETLNVRYDNAEDAQEINTLMDRITDIELEIEEIIDNNSDVYDLYPTRYSHYGLTMFEVPSVERGAEFAVGTEEEVEKAALEYAKSYIGDVGFDGFRPDYIEEYVDGDKVADYFEDSYREMIYDSPESYFDDDELGLSEEQEERIEYLENKIAELEEQLEQEDDDDRYYEIQEVIDELQEELDSIEPLGQPTDDMVEEKLEEILSDIRRNPVSYLKDYGHDIKNFIDTDELAQGVADDDGYGILSPYNNDYDTEDVNGITYYIFRID